MDHISRRGEHANFLAYGNNQMPVDFEQVVFALGCRAANLVSRSGREADEADALPFTLEIVVAPFPLITGRLDGDVRLGGVPHVEQGLGGRPGHGNEDQQGHHGPGNLHHGVIVKLGGLMTLRLAVLEHRIEHDGEDADENDHDDDHHQVVKVDHRLGGLGGRDLEIELPGSLRHDRPAHEREARQARLSLLVDSHQKRSP